MTACNPASPAGGAKCEWSGFLGHIIPYLVTPDPDVAKPPNSMVLAFIRDAAEELIHSAGLLRDSYCGMLQAGVAEIPLALPEGRTLVQVNHVRLAGGRSVGFEVAGDDMVVLHDPPCQDIEDGYTIGYSYAVPLDECAVPPELCVMGPKFKTALRHQVLAYLYGMAGMPWGNLQERNNAETRLAKAIGDLKDSMKSGSRKRRSTSAKLEERFWAM